MIQHIRFRPAGLSTPDGDARESQVAAPKPEDSACPADDSLNLLLKHAFSVAPKEHDAGNVWQTLKRKVLGPGGAPALEGPTVSSLELELTASGGWINPVPFVVKDPLNGGPMAGVKGHEALWGLLRFDSSGLPQRGCTWMLA